jgi:hypothetical protein
MKEKQKRKISLSLRLMINSRHVDSENHASIYTRECRSEEIMHAYSEII